jgi:gamma-glutamylcyclotransferase (GGCT)/AIG2-like uncharacterized protein YtfP
LAVRRGNGASARRCLAALDEYPALVEGGEGAVEGELYRVNEAELAALDRFEDVPDPYRRRAVELEGGIRAEAYFRA